MVSKGFRISDVLQGETDGQDHTRGDHWAGKRPPTSLVEASDKSESFMPGTLFITPRIDVSGLSVFCQRGKR